MISRHRIVKRKHPTYVGCFLFGIRQRPTLPGRLQPSTIGAERLNFCVRYGNRWDPFAIVTGMPMKGLCSPLSSWFPLRPFLTVASFLETLRTTRAFLLFTRTLKTAHPDFLHLAKNQSLFQFSLWSHLILRSFRSSPRPISISKLNMLPHFHR